MKWGPVLPEDNCSFHIDGERAGHEDGRATCQAVTDTVHIITEGRRRERGFISFKKNKGKSRLGCHGDGRIPFLRIPPRFFSVCEIS